LDERLAADKRTASVAPREDTVEVDYDPQGEGTGYVRRVVSLEFGARSTGEPPEKRPVTCDAARHIANVIFPSARPETMIPERTFWEKATAIHVFCRQGRFRGGERFSRHWYDIASLDDSGFVSTAIANRELATHVARHKSYFFRETDEDGEVIDYERAVTGALLP